MSTEQNKSIMRAFTDRINAKDLDGALGMLGSDYVEHAAQPGMPSGIDAARAWFTMLFAGFSDAHYTILDMIAEGDKVVIRACSEGTHTGMFMGVQPAGKRAKWSLIDIHRIAGGKIVEHWVETDQLGMMQQLGLVPPPQG